MPSSSMSQERLMRPIAPNRDNRFGRFGVTLIELILIVSMVGIIAAALYSNLESGLKVWRWSMNTGVCEDISIFLARFSIDVKNSVNFKGIGFVGAPDRLELVTLVDSARLNNKTTGKAVYVFDRSTAELRKELKDFSRVYNDEPATPLAVISGVKDVQFQYYWFDAQHKRYVWLDEWGQEGLPLSVRATIEVARDESPTVYTKTVRIPISDS
jgi:hypothetical protein